MHSSCLFAHHHPFGIYYLPVYGNTIGINTGAEVGSINFQDAFSWLEIYFFQDLSIHIENEEHCIFRSFRQEVSDGGPFPEWVGCVLVQNDPLHLVEVHFLIVGRFGALLAKRKELGNFAFQLLKAAQNLLFLFFQLYYFIL